MKPIREVTQCENCGAMIELQSPPLLEYYKHGRIDIAVGSVLLDVKSTPRKSVSHAADINGYYCNVSCLTERIQKLRKGK
jgi:hypothetical protein